MEEKNDKIEIDENVDTQEEINNNISTTDEQPHKKEKQKKVYSKYIVPSVAGFIIGGMFCSPSTEMTEKYNQFDKINSELSETKEILANLKTENEELNTLVEEAKPWFDMGEKEKEKMLMEQSREENKKWLTVVDSNVSYYKLLEDERDLIDEWLDTKYELMDKNLQEEYKEKYKSTESDREKSIKKIEEEAEKAAKEAEAKKYNTGITWENIARDGRIGEYCKFSGKVIQVINGTSATQYRVATSGSYDNVMLIEIPNSIKHKTILEDDNISFKGISAGNMEYTTVLGARMSIPAVLVEEYSFK